MWMYQYLCCMFINVYITLFHFLHVCTGVFCVSNKLDQSDRIGQQECVGSATQRGTYRR